MFLNFAPQRVLEGVWGGGAPPWKMTTVRVEQLAPREVSSAKNMSKRKTGLKWVQFSPIWTKLCQIVATLIRKVFFKPEGHQ